MTTDLTTGLPSYGIVKDLQTDINKAMTNVNELDRHVKQVESDVSKKIEDNYRQCINFVLKGGSNVQSLNLRKLREKFSKLKNLHSEAETNLKRLQKLLKDIIEPHRVSLVR